MRRPAIVSVTRQRHMSAGPRAGSRRAVVEAPHRAACELRARAGTLSVIQLLPPMTAPRPITVSPPRMVALA